jgi:hypothetical protein
VGAGGAHRRVVRRREEVVHHPPADGTDQVDGEEAGPAEQALERGSHEDQGPHVEQDVDEPQAAQPGRRRQERRRDQPVPLARGHAVGGTAVGVGGAPEQLQVVDDARVNPRHQEYRDVDPHQRPGDDGTGGRTAAERGPGLAGTPRAFTHALHALLPHRGRAHAVGARVAATPDAGNVRFPVGVAVTGRNLRGPRHDSVRPHRVARSGIAGGAHGVVQSAGRPLSWPGRGPP